MTAHYGHCAFRSSPRKWGPSLCASAFGPWVPACAGTNDGETEIEYSSGRASSAVILAERASQTTALGPVSLWHGHQLQHVAVRVLEIDSAAAAPVVELAVVGSRARCRRKARPS